MRKSAGRIFVIGLLKSLLFFVLFTLISVSSYKLFMHFYGIEDNDVIAAIPSDNKHAIIAEPQIDVVSKHLIYCVDEETGDIMKLVLEIFDCERLRLNYITIPVKTQITLSDSLHKELVLIKPSIPGFLKLSAITGYMPKETVYEYGVRIIEELLDINISYYSVVPQSIYDTVFETEAINQKSKTYPREVFSDGFLEYLHTINTETQLYNYIEELYTKINSNLTFEEKLNYMESYMNIPGRNIRFEVIAGTDSNSGYIIDKTSVDLQLKTYLGE